MPRQGRAARWRRGPGRLEPGQRGGVEVGAQVVAGLGGPERAVFHALLRDRERERVSAADRGAITSTCSSSGTHSPCRQCARPRNTECPAGAANRRRSGTDRRTRPERRSAASRPHRSHRLNAVAKPLPGCSRRCSRIRRCRARLPGRYRAGRTAQLRKAARIIRTARAITYLVIAALRPGRTARRGAAPHGQPRRSGRPRAPGRRKPSTPSPAGSRPAARAVR